MVYKINRLFTKIKYIYDSKWWLYIKYRNIKINEKQFLFESYSAANFQGNVYYLFKYFFNNQKYALYKFIIVAESPEKIKKYLINRGLLDDRVSIVKYKSKNYITKIYSSKYLFNNVTFPMDFVKKKEQIYINTWHGTPLKCLGKSVANDPFIIQNIERDFLTCQYLISPNMHTTNILENDYMICKIMPGKILEVGYPRNEIFYDHVYRNKVRSELGFENKKVILYMPTWRGAANGNKRDMDYDEIMGNLLNRLGNDYIFYFKLHPLDAGINTNNFNFRIIPDNYEIYEFLNACDILITDYSSVLFDYANASKKILLFQFDKKEYFKERGIYKGIDQIIDFPICRTVDDLYNHIINKKDCNVSKNFLKEFCYYDMKNPTHEICKQIFSKNVNDFRDDLKLIVIIEKITDEQILMLKNRYEKNELHFAFVPTKSNVFFKNLSCWKDINYLIIDKKGKYLIKERILQIIYNFIKTKKIGIYINNVKSREQKRMFGELKINEVLYWKKVNKLPDYLICDEIKRNVINL